MGRGDPRVRAEVLGAARSLALQRAAGEVTAAFRAGDVRCILLKGAALARALDDGAQTGSSRDVDLLISEIDWSKARAILEQLGFAPVLSAADRPEPRYLHAETWRREHDEACIDLHLTLPGARESAPVIWQELSARTAGASLPGIAAEVLDSTALAFHVALHAAQHGPAKRKPLSDLERALARFDDATWHEAHRLAGRLNAEAAFGVGLRLLPAGRNLAARLAVIDAPSVEDALLKADAPGGASALEYASQLPGIRRKAAMAARKLVPSPAYMRLKYPTARRGHLGLMLAYVVRQGQVALRLGPAARAWRSAHAASKNRSRR